MADLAVIVPSRGRPQQLRELLESVRDTAETDVLTLIGLDDDDPADYSSLIGLEVNAVVYRSERMSLSGWTNHLAQQQLSSAAPARYLASLGDDHRPRTPGWDRQLIQAIESFAGSGIAYGNDLLQGPRLPTAWVVSADIVSRLGWMMLPSCQHMYVDNAVLELGRALGRIAYMPHVVIEHVHPLAGKAEWDASYAESNRAERFAEDRAAFEAWMRDGLAADVDKVRPVFVPGAPLNGWSAAPGTSGGDGAR